MKNKGPSVFLPWLVPAVVLFLANLSNFLFPSTTNEMLLKARALIGLSFIAVSLYTLGNEILLLLKKFFRQPSTFSLTNPWNFIYSFVLGTGLVSFVIIFIGNWLPGALSTQLSFIMALLSLFFVYGLYQHSGRCQDYVSGLRFQIHGGRLVLAVVVFAGAGFAFLSSFSPITYFDSLANHLNLPKAYLVRQNIEVIPYSVYSYFTKHVEMIFMLVLDKFPAPEYVINLFTWFFSVLVGLGIFSFLKQIKGENEGWTGMALWWSLPCVLFISVGGYVDIPLSMFVFLSVLSFIRHRKNSKEPFWAVVSGLMAGFAVATKYTGAICPIVIGGLLLFQARREKNSLRSFFLFSISAVTPCLPWFIKNFQETGNPFFPVFFEVWGHPAPWAAQAAEALFSSLGEYGGPSRYVTGILDLFFMPWNIPGRFGGGMDILGTYGWWPFVLWGAPLLLLVDRKNPIIKTLFAYSVFHFILWFFGKPMLRYLMGLLPILCVLSGAAIGHFLFKGKQAQKALALISAGAVLAWHVMVSAELAVAFETLKVPLGYEKGKEFLARRLVYYPVHQFANANLSSQNKIFLFGDERGYHLSIPFSSSHHYSKSPLAEVFNKAGSPEDISLFFKEGDFSHFLLNVGELQRLGGLDHFGFTEKGAERFVFYIRTLKPLNSNNGVTLFEIPT